MYFYRTKESHVSEREVYWDGNVRRLGTTPETEEYNYEFEDTHRIKIVRITHSTHHAVAAIGSGAATISTSFTAAAFFTSLPNPAALSLSSIV